MAFEHYVYSGRERLRCGFTTGTCAALAAKAASRMLLTGEKVERVCLITPRGWTVEAEVEQISLENGRYNASLLLAHKIARYFELTIEDVFLFEEEDDP